MSNEHQTTLTNSSFKALHPLSSHGIMDLESVRQLYDDMRKKEQILSVHKNKITKPKDEKSRWQTFVGKGAERKKIAAQTERELLNKLHDHYYQQELSLEALFPEWLEKRNNANVSARTIERNKNHWDKYYSKHKLAQKPIADITVFDLEDFLHEHIREHSLTLKELNNMKFILKDMLHMCKRKAYIKENLFHDIEIKKEACKPPNKPNDASRIYLPEGAGTLLPSTA